jgi:autotransporter-associated beta strand protein
MGNTGAAYTAGGSGASGLVVVRYLGSSAGTGGSLTSGSGTANGYTLHTFTGTGASTLTLNAIAPTFSGRISGAGGLSVNAAGVTLTLSGNNSYTGNTVINSGKVITSHVNALGNNSAVTLSNISGALLQLNSSLNIGSLAGGGSTGGNLVLGAGAVLATGSNDTSTTFGGAISGAGGMTKVGSGTWTVTSNGTYTGATTVSAGRLVLSNNAPTTASSSFTGAGDLRIESVGTGFTGAFSTSGWTFGSTLGGLTVGKTTNTSAVSLYDIAMAGPINAFGGTLNVNGNLNTTAGGVSGDVLLKSSGDISVATNKSITTAGGDVVLWSNSDGQSTNGGLFMFANSAVITGGGHLWMAGGSGSATWNGLTVGDGYATSGTNITVGALNFDKPAVFLQDTTLSTGGGDIYIRGKTTSFRGFLTTGQGVVDAGSGKIYIEGTSETTGGGAGIGWHDGASVLTITSSNAASDAIVWLSDASASDGAGIAGEGAGMAGTTSLIATGGGGVRFTSLGSTSQTNSLGIRLG